jgi:hypothetical protein
VGKPRALDSITGCKVAHLDRGSGNIELERAWVVCGNEKLTRKNVRCPLWEKDSAEFEVVGIGAVEDIRYS